MTQPPEAGDLRAAQVALIDMIISMYHTTRIAGTPAADHILSKRIVRTAFERLLALSPAPSQGDVELRVARAIHEWTYATMDEASENAWEDLPERDLQIFRSAAKSAIAAMPVSAGETDAEAMKRIVSNAVAQCAATAIRSSFFTSVSGGGRYHLSLAYRTMDEMHAAEDHINRFLREEQFLPLQERLKARALSDDDGKEGR